MKLGVVPLLFASIVPISVHAGPNWLYGRHIKNISVNECPNCSQSFIAFQTDETTVNPKSCAAVDQYVVNDTDPVRVNRALTVLLSALSTGASITFAVDDGGCSFSQRPIVLSNIIISK